MVEKMSCVHVPKKNEEVIKRAVAHWGVTSQVLMAIEELGELSVELCHSLRANKPFDIERIMEEVVDVRFMLNQLQYMLKWTDEEEQQMKTKKHDRLIEIMETEDRMDAESRDYK